MGRLAQKVEVVTPEAQKLADNAQSRSHIYGLLAAVFREEPNEALIQELREPRMAAVLSDLGVGLCSNFHRAPSTELVEKLGLEYCRVFVGPAEHVSAHESVFSQTDGNGGGGLWGSKTVEVKNFIQATGLDYAESFSGIPDHISVELEFMQKLTKWEADAWLENDSKHAEESQNIQKMFLEQHLLRWVSPFCDAVIQRAELPFYREMAELTSRFFDPASGFHTQPSGAE